jgi:molybdopterin-guanine dinucleotide biosynthesis protein A
VTRVAALVLAGGAATRMGGGDKPLLEVGGRPMLARILRTLEAELSDIAISANGDPARFAALGRPVLDDGAFAGEGPLAGILAGLDWAAALDCSALLSVPGDTPFIPRGLPALLAPPPACAVQGDRTHHLVALWPVAARADLRALLAAPRGALGGRSVAQFGARIGMRGVEFATGPPWFVNVNTADDLAAARLVAEGLDDADGGDRGAGGDRPAPGTGA